ncbi:mannose-6-phosphate isomerase, class I [Knoellia locipacati]|uniref:mannose-6-phosphate isomerase n=1 Tax=Knoellia locipacati TaxID=882824 RepID=A0A512SWR8_9MICO|nr:mannose-6-phosphate isomerase, class I [Knoellia locipacati]GEQ12387.1 putative mannose-6-phosphate isomerase ManA [Knoellia locipacati]
MDQLEPVLFTDAWGSHVSIASLQGRSIPSAEPESELWMGAHESGPCGLVRDGVATTLADVIRADPEGEMGAECCTAYEGRLPFLLKVLAPGRAISIQAHPTAAQASEIRARDREAGDKDATYVDDWAKPEMLVAISPFRVFVGMRSPDEVADLAKRLGVTRLSTLVDDARTAPDPAHSLLAAILAIPKPEQAGFVRELVAACVRVSSSPDDAGHQCAAVVRVAEDHPDDIGLAVLLLMRHHVLEPGDYIDVPAGVLHSYVSGLGIEVLANSDNVVRAGLTGKEINIPELLRIVDPEADGLVGHAERDPDLPATDCFPSSSDRFALRRLHTPAGQLLPGDGTPRLVLCLHGDVLLAGPTGSLALGPVQAAFLSARDHDVVATGSGEVYLVTLPTI